MADLNSILGDPDFLASTPETKRQILSAHDQDFAAATSVTQDQILARYGAPAAEGGIVSSVNAGLTAARNWMQPAANNLVNFAGDVASDFLHPSAAVDTALRGTGPRSLFSGPSPETQAPPSSGAGRFAAEVVNPVPGNLPDAGAQAGTIALGPYGALWRIIGGAGGAGIGKGIEGGNAAEVGKAAGLAGLGNVVGEGVAGLGSWVAKSIPGAVTRIRNQDAARFIEAAPTVSPGLGRLSLEGNTASAALQDLARKGKQGLSDAKEEAIQRIESALQSPTPRPATEGGVGQAQGPVGPGPEPPLPGNVPQPGQERALGEVNTPWAPNPAGEEAWRPRDLIGPRGVMLEIPSIGRPVTLREANAELTAIGEGLRHAQILDPTMRQREAGRAYATLSTEIHDALEAQAPGLGRVFQETQQAYAAGLDFLKKIAGSNNWRPGAQGIEFDPRNLQSTLAKDPLGQQRAGERMGDEGMDAFVQALTRGEGLGRVDRVPAGGGGAADALMAWLRGTNSGSMGLPQSLIRSVVPNAGAQYIGRKPYTIDPGLKVLMDIIGQRSMDRALSGTPVKIGPIP